MRFALSIFILLFSLAASAQPKLTPKDVIHQTGDKLFSRIATSQAELQKFPELMRNIVEEELMPVVDYRYAAFKILGKHVRKASKEQRTKFVSSMKHYLVRTYATALNQYKDQKVTYGQSKISKSGRTASVDALITEDGKPDIHLTFQMRKNKKTGQWKAYDMIVEGISLLSSKQAEFSSRISKHGIDQVTVELASLSK
ncbi:MlaC/ttg2D family ABC transporter substrate-binding protein [Thalassotalea sediminis]|uniref:MlaC/ttg2D family ABC transporter substrate-binding protein n=1 Tax=Thalassotalea sediminis TaxID=1759089 RepID=UPI002572D8C5|nr:ABC transporter substrate-binding protein [Thalassotalea sediminis]